MFWGLYKQIRRGKSLLRSYMNLSVSGWAIEGKVVDIGGGKDPSYLKFMDSQRAQISNIDFKADENKNIDLEKDPLPFSDNSADFVLAFNILEHIYNHRFLVGEMKRILKPSGRIYGFVPFLIQYHPDPKDFFRYTKEALNKIFTDAGLHVESIKEVGAGPFSVNFNNLMFAMPVFVRLAIFPFYYFADKIVLKLRPNLKDRYPLGFTFKLIS